MPFVMKKDLEILRVAVDNAEIALSSIRTQINNIMDAEFYDSETEKEILPFEDEYMLAGRIVQGDDPDPIK